MACEICGKTSCTRSFHSLADQEEYDNQVDNVKEGIKNNLLRGLRKLTDYYAKNDVHCVSVSEVESLIEDVLW